MSGSVVGHGFTRTTKDGAILLSDRSPGSSALEAISAGARDRAWPPPRVGGSTWRRLNSRRDAPSPCPDAALPGLRGFRRRSAGRPPPRARAGAGTSGRDGVQFLLTGRRCRHPDVTRLGRPQPFATGERIARDLDEHLRILPVERPAGVRQAVALADLAHARGNNLVAITRHVGEEGV